MADEPKWNGPEIAEKGRLLLNVVAEVEGPEAGQLLLILMAAVASLYRSGPPGARAVVRRTLRRLVDEMDATA